MSKNSIRRDVRKAQRKLARQEKLAERGNLNHGALKRAEWGWAKAYGRSV